jgi:diacylglycerol O-acyltransferase / wax synthase
VNRLPAERPLWRLTFLTDGRHRCHALIVVAHHVLADGLGGIATLLTLLDASASPPDPQPFPTRGPTRGEILRDAMTTRLASLYRLPRTLGRLPSAVTELGGRRAMSTSHRAPRCTLNRPISSHRRLATVRTPLEVALTTARRHGATLNDLLLVTVTGALAELLRSRGEVVSALVVSVPVSSRRGLDDRTGNHVGVQPVAVPTTGALPERLAAIAGTTRARPSRSERGSSAAVLSVAVRILTGLGLFGWFISRQRLINTFVTNLRGPTSPQYLMGARVVDLIPVSPIAGNVTVAFAALSYAGNLTVTVVADPAACPDLDLLTDALRRQLAEVGVIGG